MIPGASRTVLTGSLVFAGVALQRTTNGSRHKITRAGNQHPTCSADCAKCGAARGESTRDSTGFSFPISIPGRVLQLEPATAPERTGGERSDNMIYLNDEMDGVSRR